MPLSDLPLDRPATVVAIEEAPHGSGLEQRLAAMGVAVNRSVKVLRKAGWGGPLHVRVGATTEIAIRRQEAARVWVRWP
ncbi:FeoA family protein [Halomicronema hongdechloris]|uniref:FeoA family protein n=1 Tax=Halomicronema hongdechloris TaxID=1209493 RepID=UPI0009BA397E|nr:FeoA family protein [Halomicronema hongdechloris]